MLTSGPEDIMLRIAIAVEQLEKKVSGMAAQLEELANGAPTELAVYKIATEIRIRGLEDWKLKMVAYATVISTILSGVGFVAGHYWH